MEASCTVQTLRNCCKFFSESDKKKLARAISKNQVSDPGPSWPSSFLLARLRTTCSRGAFRVVLCLSSSPPKLLGQFGSNLTGMFLGRSSSKILSKSQVAMATKLNFLSNSLKIFPGTTGLIFSSTG